jgi:hypothetical protein
MSRVIAPTEADAPAVLRPAFDSAARQVECAPTMRHARAAGPNAVHGWLDARKAMSTSLNGAPPRRAAHTVARRSTHE